MTPISSFPLLPKLAPRQRENKTCQGTSTTTKCITRGCDTADERKVSSDWSGRSRSTSGIGSQFADTFLGIILVRTCPGLRARNDDLAQEKDFYISKWWNFTPRDGPRHYRDQLPLLNARRTMLAMGRNYSERTSKCQIKVCGDKSTSSHETRQTI